MRLTRTCRLIHALVHSFLKRTFNINRFLSRFFSDPIDFRSLQARTGTLISGSYALQFFDRTFYPESDLDLYVSYKSDTEVTDWLVQVGYVYTPREKQPPTIEEALEDTRRFLGEEEHDEEYIDASILGVLNFQKSVPGEIDRDLKVQCIIAREEPVVSIFRFHSSKSPVRILPSFLV